MLNIICALLGHHRSKRHRRHAAGVWISRCYLCRTRMERIGPGQWLPISDRRHPTPKGDNHRLISHAIAADD